MEIVNIIAQRLNINEQQVQRTIKLLNEGATIPFISRYRKEVTGGLNEVEVAAVKDENDRLSEMQHRKNTILLTIDEQGKLTDELRKRIENCWDSTVLEDIYLPYKPKRHTRAEKARQRGLEPLADLLMKHPDARLDTLVAPYLTDEVLDEEAALQGARDIIAERVSENEEVRNTVRTSYSRQAWIRSTVVKGKEEEAQKYRDYFDNAEPLSRCSSHRLLAMRRGEAEGCLRVSIAPHDEEQAIGFVLRKCDYLFEHGRPQFVRESSQLHLAAVDAYKRLLRPSIETEFAGQSKAKADADAIRVFASNLKQLLLAPPLGQQRIMGIDPGFRTGCKVVCLDAQGTLLHNETIYPHPPKQMIGSAMRKVRNMIEVYKPEAIAIGNGTAGRETETFINSLNLGDAISVFLVSEDGASVYSASKLAREEFPDYDVTVRGAVSIGRRLADPLAELVKIDPKAIGVGQYQHDVDQSELKKSLDLTVESCVNAVGVNLNTASKSLLTYVSGLGPALAQNIVDYRIENGPFSSRRDLLKVPRLGAKAYEQCAGFLRIPDAVNPLDNTAVHPERYALVEQMAKDEHCDVPELVRSAEKRKAIDLQKYCTDAVGLPTLNDIISELGKPGRDPRGHATVFRFDEKVKSVEDLKIGMELPGVITNITDFGCFVNLGIHKDGLIHKSNLANHRVTNPAEVVHIQQRVVVRVLEIDECRGRIGLKLVTSEK